MKVLQFGRFYPPDIGGIESVIYDLTEGLNASGIRCDVLCSNKANKTVVETASSGYTIYRSASVGQFLSTSISLQQISILRSIASQYDIIHIHHPDPMATLALFVSGYKGKIVVHWHSDIVRQKISFVFYEWLQRWLLRRTSAVIATSENYARSSQHLKDFRAKIAVVPIGTDVSHQTDESFFNGLKEMYKGRRIVFSLGRHVYYKGFEYLIDALPLLSADTVVLIGGEGPLKKKLEEQASKLSLKCEVEFLGRIPENELSSYFKVCDVFCLASIERSEAFGVVLLEAMYFGKPIIATNIPGSGVNWVNQHMITGINVEPRDSNALAQAINDLTSDTVRYEQLSKNAFNRYNENFTQKIMVDKIRALFSSL